MKKKNKSKLALLTTVLIIMFTIISITNVSFGKMGVPYGNMVWFDDGSGRTPTGSGKPNLQPLPSEQPTKEPDPTPKPARSPKSTGPSGYSTSDFGDGNLDISSDEAFEDFVNKYLTNGQSFEMTDQKSRRRNSLLWSW